MRLAPVSNVAPARGPVVRLALVSIVVAAVVTAGAAATPASGPQFTASGPQFEGPPTSDPSPGDGVVLELYPNPPADGDVGEYLVVDLPVRGNWTLWDGYHAADVPDHVAGRIALATEPDAAAEHVELPVYELEARFPLADDGDRIELRYEGRAVDAVSYDRATETEVWHRDVDDDRETDGFWRPYGFEPRNATGTGSATIEGFVLPDDPETPVAPFERADDRILLAAYTLESWRVAGALADAAARGVDVRVLVEGGPVGGISETGAAVLDHLAANGVEVRVLSGPKTRFSFHHAKYAVADDEAVVLTENWKPAGTGGAGSRGWGVRVADDETAEELAAVFADDAGWQDARTWSVFREDRTFYEREPADGDYPERFDSVSVEARSVAVLTAPGNAANRLVRRIDAADERAFAVVPRTGGANQRLVRALVTAAERGVEVRLLLSGVWYDVEENAALAETLNARAEREDLPLSVEVAEPRGRFEKVHAKGLVVDETVVVGSLNWNEHAATKNRELLLAIESPELADYFVRVYAADWRGGTAMLPLGLVGGLGAAVGGALLLARREVSFY